jgi:AraC-like DNA-binding protein
VTDNNTDRRTSLGAARRSTDRRSRAREDTIALVLGFVDRHEGRLPHIADLCEAAGVSERTLRSIFTQAFGVAPHRYLRTRRMHRIRAILSAADARQTVSGVAKRFGYSDAGRMASEYRALFGEYPSATLGRRFGKRD